MPGNTMKIAFIHGGAHFEETDVQSGIRQDGVDLTMVPSPRLAARMTGVAAPPDAIPARMNMAQGISLEKAADAVTSNVSDIAEAWRFKTGNWVCSSPCLGPDGTVYVGSNDNRVYALKDGKKLWEFKTGGKVWSSPCVGPDGRVYVGSGDGNIYALRNPEDALRDGMRALADNADTVDATPAHGVNDDGATIYEGWLIVGGVKIPMKE